MENLSHGFSRILYDYSDEKKGFVNGKTNVLIAIK